MAQSRTPKTAGSELKTFIYANGSNTYIAKAPSYATTNSAMWQIKIIDGDSANNTQIKWADGDTKFDNILDNYSSLTYI